MNEIVLQVKKIVEKINKDKHIQYDDKTDLFSVGILDSLGMVEFIQELEETFKIAITNEDLIPQSFWSIEATSMTISKYR